METPQMELPGLPQPTKLSPIEDVNTLEEVLCQVLKPMNNELRVTTALGLIQFTGELCVTLSPVQVVDKTQKPMNSRPIIMEHNMIAKSVLRALHTVAEEAR